MVKFGSSYSNWRPEAQIYDRMTLREAESYIDGISANMGGTEIYNPLDSVINTPAIGCG